MTASDALPSILAPLVAEGEVVLCLVRHGQTAWNATGRFLGRRDEPLDATGRAQVAALASGSIPTFSAVYTSPLSRARDTARAVSPAPVADAGWIEQHQGALEGLDGPSALQRYPDFFAAWAQDPATAPVPGGETLGAVRDRVVASLRRVAAAHPPGAVVGVFTHQMVIATAACTVADEPLSRWRSHRAGNVQATVIAVRGGTWRLVGERVPLVAAPASEVAGA